MNFSQQIKSSFCYCCRTRQFLSDHHLKPRSEGGTNHPDNLVTLCQDCHDLVEGPADGAWDRVVKLKESIKSGKIAKSKIRREADKRRDQDRLAEYERQKVASKKQALELMGMVVDEAPVSLSLLELKAKRRSQGYLNEADSRRWNLLTFGEKATHLLFDAPLQDFVTSIVARAGLQ